MKMRDLINLITENQQDWYEPRHDLKPGVIDEESEAPVEENTLQTRTELNQGNYPVVDCNGKPFTPACRIRYRQPAYYVNTKSGEGTFRYVDQYGNIYYTADQPEPVYMDRNGSYSHKSREQEASTDYHHSGPMKGMRVAAGKLGDRFEHGQADIFVEIID